MSLLNSLFHNQGKGRPIGGGVVPWYLSGDIHASNCIAAYPLNELSGTTAFDVSGNGRNGTYSNAILGQPGIGDGNTAISLSGVSGTNHVNIYSVSLANAFNGAAGTISAWFKTNSVAEWVDGLERFILNIEVDSNNFVYLSKKAQSNKIWFGYRAGGTYDAIDGLYYNPTKWTHIAITWNKAAEEMKVYLNGVQQGATQTALGTWVGIPGSTKMILGNYSTNYNGTWKGSIARASFYNIALTQTQIQKLAYTYWDGFNGLLINFDDQYDSVLTAYQYMLARNLPGTIYVCTNNVNQAGYLTNANLVTMESNGWVLGNHTRDHTVLTDLNLADQEAELDDARDALVGWGLNATNATYVAYPNGGWNTDTWTAMTNQGMLTGRTTTGGISACDDPAVVHPYHLSYRWTGAAGVPVSQVQAAINNFRTNGKWGTIMFHRFVESSPSGNQWLYSQFYELIDWIVSEGIPCRTIADYYAAR